jgi:hypothetical protein
MNPYATRFAETLAIQEQGVKAVDPCGVLAQEVLAETSLDTVTMNYLMETVCPDAQVIATVLNTLQSHGMVNLGFDGFGMTAGPPTVKQEPVASKSNVDRYVADLRKRALGGQGEDKTVVAKKNEWDLISRDEFRELKDFFGITHVAIAKELGCHGTLSGLFYHGSQAPKLEHQETLRKWLDDLRRGARTAPVRIRRGGRSKPGNGETASPAVEASVSVEATEAPPVRVPEDKQHANGNGNGIHAEDPLLLIVAKRAGGFLRRFADKLESRAEAKV